MDKYLEEYKEVCANVRQYVNLRFAQMTLFVAITSGLISTLFLKQQATTIIPKLVIKIGGIISLSSFG